MVKRKETAGAPMKIDQRLVQASNRFGISLFHRFVREEPGDNIFISPAGVCMAMAMALNGAAGETRRAMERALLYGKMNLDELNGAFADLKNILLNPGPGVELALANSLWARAGSPFHEDFTRCIGDFYDAAVSELDFDRPEAAARINTWVKERTRGKIEKIVEPPINPLALLFLINAIYFKGKWIERFNPRLTREIPFTLPDGSRKRHPVMIREGEYRYLAGDIFQAVRLPYGETRRVSMYIFLPRPGRTLDQFYRELDADAWAEWPGSFVKMEGEVGLPRFGFEYEATLNNALQALGMEIAFDEGAADFSGMRPVPPDLFIGEVKHKTFVKVNEAGTEAAAATSAEMRLTAMPARRFSLVADRPFCSAVADDRTGTLLFIGSVNDPAG